MKVISQLVKHFWQRGALTATEAEYLVRHGFVRERDLPGFARPVDVSDHPPALDPAIIAQELHEDHQSKVAERLESTLLRRRAGVRKQGAAKGEAISVDEICRRLKAEFARREVALRRLSLLAARCGNAEDWPAAVLTLRNAPPEKFRQALAAVFRGGTVGLKELWQALDPEAFHRLIRDEEYSGRSANAYSALLVVDDLTALGKYAWVLRRDEVQAAFNLRAAHRRLLEALNHLFHHEPRALQLALDRGSEPTATWALVLLHNANRAEKAKARRGATGDYGPVEAPGDEVWQQAWTAALGMDRTRVTQLLVNCYQQRDLQDERNPQVCGPLYCPAGWHLPTEVASDDGR